MDKPGGGRPIGGFVPPSSPVAGGSDTQPAVALKQDEHSGLRSEFADKLSAALRTPILVQQSGEDEESPDERSLYSEESYAEDSVHEQRFDAIDRSNGPLSLSGSTIDIDGVTYRLRFVRCKDGGEVDTSNLANAQMAGWAPLPADKLPKYWRAFAFKSDLGDNLYIVKDTVLMIRPAALEEKAWEREQRIADNAIRRVEQNMEFETSLPRDRNMHSVAQKPYRQTVTGRHATAAVQDALDNAAANSESYGKPVVRPHQIRGFGPYRTR